MEYDPSQAALNIGDHAPYFSLPATDGKIYSISDFADAPALAIVFMGNHCPYARAYEFRLCEIAKEFREQKVAVIAICSNDGVLFPEDSFEQMVEKSKRYDFAYLYLQDAHQSVARAYSAKRTPEAFLFDADKSLRYHGAIDDNYADADAVIESYLADGIRALLSGKSPAKEHTPIIGCSIKFSPASSQQ